MQDRTVRWGGYAALVFVVLILISVFIAGEPPAADDAVDKIRTFLVDNRSALLAGNLLGLVGMGFAVWFAVVLRGMFSRGDEEATALGVASLAGMILASAMAMAGGAVSVSTIYLDGAAQTLGADTIHVVYLMQGLLFASTSAGLVLFALTSALAIRKTGALPSYVMWFGLLCAACNILTMVTTLDAGSASMGLFGVMSFALYLLVAGGTMAAGRASADA